MHVFHWGQHPFLRLIIGLVIGILIGVYSDLELKWATVVIAILVLYLSAIAWNCTAFSSSTQAPLGLVCLLILGLSGYARVLQYPEIGNKSHFHSHLSQIQAFQGVVIRPSWEARTGLRTPVEILQIRTEGRWKVASGKLLLYHKINSGVGAKKYGTLILSTSTPKFVQSPKNPGQFDYQEYLAAENIFHTALVDSITLIEMGKKSGTDFLDVTFRMRSYLRNVILCNVQKRENQAIAMALLIGDKSKISPHLRRDFAKNGIAHILAVSGLHVGILFLVIRSLLNFLKISNSAIAVLVQLSSLFCYALLTGWSPSVLRACSMFAAVIIGQNLNRSNSIYNNLSFSAFCLLMINPFYLTLLGFQLSYLAVLGIAYYQTKIEAWFVFQNPLLFKIWSLTSLTASAQILTFPLILYHFHQYSSIFLLTNLIVIPMVTVILCAGLLLLLLGWWQWIATMLGIFLTGMLDCLFFITRVFGDFGFSSIENVYITSSEALLLFLIIGSCTVFFNVRRFSWLILTAIIMTLLTAFKLAELNTYENQKKVVFYSNYKSPLVQLISGRESTIFGPDITPKIKDIPWFVAENNLANGLSKGLGLHVNAFTKVQNEKWDLIVFEGLKILWIKKIWNFTDLKSLKLEYLVLNCCPPKGLSKIVHSLTFEKLVLGPLPKDCRFELVQEAKQFDLSVHDLNKESLEIQIE